ncbi:hypothetical protein QLX08_005206 [Tetragonisca angustula]|uniref:Uncharacterized protein n=1 Tax=Tetragonisca angustula TaxID=166442 RepID=A0AAW1A1S6_9HYME
MTGPPESDRLSLGSSPTERSLCLRHFPPSPISSDVTNPPPNLFLHLALILESSLLPSVDSPRATLDYDHPCDCAFPDLPLRPRIHVQISHLRTLDDTPVTNSGKREEKLAAHVTFFPPLLMLSTLSFNDPGSVVEQNLGARARARSIESWTAWNR